jgi:hypothetical protein
MKEIITELFTSYSAGKAQLYKNTESNKIWLTTIYQINHKIDIKEINV